MKYSVYYNNNVECNHVAEFDTLDEAKAYCVANTKDYDEIGEGDNCYEGRSNNFHYEVYEGDSDVFLDEDGDVADLKTPVYQTEQYYCK
nr:MAG TPA: ETC complex I subunit conserved region [Caudoviricetes sp.]